MTDTVQLIGRSSSHFTRVARIFALELHVTHTFRPVLELASLEAAMYAGNPALKVPILRDEHGPLFGAENICRELVRRSERSAAGVVMRGDIADRVVANAEELTLHVMSSEVTLIMASLAGAAHLAPPKVAPSMQNSLHHLDETLDAALAKLPGDRALSFLEVTLFCALTHLTFREVTDIAAWPRLVVFSSLFGERESARATPYRFDAQ